MQHLVSLQEETVIISDTAFNVHVRLEMLNLKYDISLSIGDGLRPGSKSVAQPEHYRRMGTSALVGHQGKRHAYLFIVDAKTIPRPVT